jgi:hypothetical protein
MSAMQRSIAFFAMTLVAAGLGLASATQAQTSPAPKPAAEPSTISEVKLDATAAAVKRVSEVKDDFEQKLARAPAADKERVADEANNAIVKAVTDQGLSVEEYVSIMNVAQNDPAVRGKLVERLKK